MFLFEHTIHSQHYEDAGEQMVKFQRLALEQQYGKHHEYYESYGLLYDLELEK